MAYDKTIWVNNSSPPINDTNLNHIETGIDEAHDAVENLSTGHNHDGTDSKNVIAANITNTPAGNIAATNAQAAINELDDEKVAKSTFGEQSILAAVAADTPVAVTVAEQTLVGRITGGNIDDLSIAQVQALIDVEAGADVTDATNVNAAGAVMESDFGEQTILAATTNNTPITVGISPSRFIGRTDASDIEDLTSAEALVILGVEAGADVTDATNVNDAGAVMGSDYNANTILAANTNDTPTALTVAVNTLIGRGASGNIDDMDVGAQSFTNLLENGDFESWSAGTSAAPDGWNFVTGAISRETSPKLGTYCEGITRAGSDAFDNQDVPNHTNYQGRTVTFGCWVKTSTASQARIRVRDHITAITSSYHTGGGTWEWLTAILNVNATATSLKCQHQVMNTNGIAYFDGAILVEGSVCPAFSPKPLIDDGITWHEHTPSAANASGKAGQVCWDTSYIYVCTATDTWKRVAIATW